MATPDIFSAPPRPAVEGGPPFDLVSDFEQDYVTVDTGVSGDIHLIGHNLQAHLAELNKRMVAAAAELEFEEAAGLRDEIRRLQATELGLDRAGAAPAAAARAGWGRGKKRGKGKKGKMRRRGA